MGVEGAVAGLWEVYRMGLGLLYLGTFLLFQLHVMSAKENVRLTSDPYSITH